MKAQTRTFFQIFFFLRGVGGLAGGGGGVGRGCFFGRPKLNDLLYRILQLVKFLPYDISEYLLTPQKQL